MLFIGTQFSNLYTAVDTSGTTKPSVVETKDAHGFVSKASLPLEGPMVPSHESFQLPVEVARLGVVDLLLYQLISMQRADSGTVPLCF